MGPRRVHAVSIVVLAVTLLLTVFGAMGARVSANDTEQRLLEDRTDAAGALLRAVVLNVQTPLASAAELAESADGDPEVFRSFLADEVGEPGSDGAPPFASAALFDVDTGEVLATLGSPTALGAGGPQLVDEMIARTLATPGILTVFDVLELGSRRVGYAWSSTDGTPTVVVYAEAALPAQPTAVPRAPGPYEDLHFALYLGDTDDPARFLYSSTGDLPLDGRTARTVVEFGDNQLLLVMQATEPMAGRLAQLLSWLIGAGGLLLALGLAALVERLLRGRDGARVLALEIGGLYDEQRRIADTLQRSLLPPRLTPPPGMQVVSRYWPASDRTTVGGDFYDVFDIDAERWGVVIGDVCGKGVEAAALTALTRHTMRAAARHASSPTTVLQWAHEAIERAHGGATFATACVGLLQPAPAGEAGMVVRLALGGHDQPLLCRADGTVEAVGRHGSLLGVVEPVFHETVHVLAPGDRLVLFTDGVTDAPGARAIAHTEVAAALAAGRHLDADGLAEVIRGLVEDRRPGGLTDDTALLVLAVDPPDAAMPSTSEPAMGAHREDGSPASVAARPAAVSSVGARGTDG